MAESLLPQLNSTEAREAVAEAIMALFARWDLHEVNQAQLLGLPSVLNLKRKIVDADTSTMERAGGLLAIDRALKKNLGPQHEMCDRWVFDANKYLDGLTPLSVMLDKGLPGIHVIQELAESGG